MSYREALTDIYTLSIEFPETYQNDYASVSGVMELIDVEVVAKQVVSP